MKLKLIPMSASNALLRRTPKPLGLIVVMVLAAALAAWTARRIAVAEATLASHRPKKESPAENHAPDIQATAPPPLLPAAPPAVTLARPVKTSWSPVIEVEGTLAPGQVADLSFPVSGKLAWLRGKLGDYVALGTRLAGLETSLADTQVAAAEARVFAATAQWELANDSANRAHAMFEAGAHSQVAANQTAAQKRMARAELDAARAQTAQAHALLNEYTLRAPFAGTLVQAPTGIGRVVGPGQALFRLADLKTLKLDATVSEVEAALVKVGAVVVINTEQGPLEGRIRSVLDTLDEQTRRVPIQVEFEHPGTLHAGSWVRASVEASESTEVLRIPRDALLPGSEREIAVVAAGSPATLAVRRIDYATDVNGDLLVRSGLNADDAVVMRPGSDAKTGDAVSIAGTLPQ